MIDGKKCIVGTHVHLDVRDEFAFDIDESVTAEITFRLGPDDTDVNLTYDNSAGIPATKTFRLPRSEPAKEWRNETVTLDRARFAGLGRYASDFTIGEWWPRNGKILTICGIVLRRSYKTAAQQYGQLALSVLDETGQPVPARVGIYDHTDRLPLPESEAIPVRYSNVTRRVTLPLRYYGGGIQWPSKNRTAFFVNGHYHARLPVGTYDLVVAKGPEYRLEKQRLSITSEKTEEAIVRLRRWINMPLKGWYSGDPHVHYQRDSADDDRNLLGLTQAEDVHVGSILEMGTTGGTYFPQYALASVASEMDPSYVLKTGQEDPRTSKRGHSLHLNLKEFVRNPGEYMLYHKVFENTRAQGSVTGYAHVVDGEGFNGYRTGLALDVPFGLVDIVEVLPGGASGAIWFDYLNLGYRLVPSAGSDCCMQLPGGVVPGAVRSYVRVRGAFTSQAWFDGLKRGETFVTNGPILEFNINGREMGSKLELKSGDKLEIRAKASINPDVDLLHRLELIEQGDVVKAVSSKSGAEELGLKLTAKVHRGTWYVLRAYGSSEVKSELPIPSGRTVALSAPIFIDADGRKFWKPSAVPFIVERVKQDLQKVLVSPKDNPDPDEPWDRAEPDIATWDVQKIFLQQRVAEASAKYDVLLKQARDEIRSRH